MEHNENGPEQTETKAPYLQLFILILGTFMAVLDNTIVNVAIPKMEPALNANTNQIQWVITAYMLVSGVTIPLTSWLSDKMGSRRLFTYSLAFFTFGSAMCGLSWDLGSIVIFRIIQALGGGFLMPIANMLIFRIFPPQKRGGVMGIFGLAVMLAPAFGPLLSGYFVQYLSWRFVFYVNVPFGILGVIFSSIFLIDIKSNTVAKLDFWGFLLSTSGLFSLLYGFTNVSTDGWTSLAVYPFLILGAFLLLVLIVVELTVEHPLIELRILKDYLLSMSIVITSLIQLAMFVGLFLLPLYLENIMAYTPLKTGVFMTPAALLSAVFMIAAGLLLNRVGARLMAIVGISLAVIGTYGFAFLGINTTEGHLQFLYILRTIGTSVALMPVMTAGMNRLSHNLLGQASGLSNTIRQVASSLGTAVFTYYLEQRTKLHEYHLASQITQFSPQGISLETMQAAFMQHGYSASSAHLLAIGIFDKIVYEHSFVVGMNDTFMLGTIVTLVGLIVSFFFNDRKYHVDGAESPMLLME